MIRSIGCTEAVSIAARPFSASWIWRIPSCSSVMRVICRTLFWSSTTRTFIAMAFGILLLLSGYFAGARLKAGGEIGQLFDVQYKHDPSVTENGGGGKSGNNPVAFFDAL